MQIKLLSLDPPDARHKENVLAVGTVEFTFDDGESIVVTDYRLIQNSRPGPNWVAPPTRYGPNNRIPIVMTTRKTLREVEDLIMDAYSKRQLAALAAAVKASADAKEVR